MGTETHFQEVDLNSSSESLDALILCILHSIPIRTFQTILDYHLDNVTPLGTTL